ncbi:ABC transporter permease [Niabella drilacis]|uniref:ABC-type antimicrobial peptide transport system, permease component n=1 Tax=Niabella drilacis (strain DSM 25811 / CCM 8410 / CCUG 62505 / LMG 26954 / E90) TaxID=1285928 RepID=A0A1G7AHU0_NIADE|nr:ABC transporter permease [Niabella drilacis]SDE14504.1 ABC-type antimicrobial peptide transport system, permease component [Niabella drilacis]
MIRNYLKTAWRNLIRNRLYGGLNITGLGIAMAACFILLLYVYHEFSYDRHNEKLDRIYQVYTNFKNNNEITTGKSTPVGVARVAKQDFPQVEEAAVTAAQGERLFGSGDRVFRLETLAASLSFFNIFSFSFLQGTPSALLKDQASVVLTRSSAVKLFGRIDVVGETIQYNKEHPLQVAAVIDDLPINASVRFDALIPWNTFLGMEQWVKEEAWYNYSFNSYILAKEHTDVRALNSAFDKMLLRMDHNKDNNLFLFPFSKAYLYDAFKNGIQAGGRIEYVRLFLILALCILVTGCINFMNMSTARSIKRAREVGIRKAIGARRSLLVTQFISESVLMAVLSFIIALTLMMVLLPLFNRLMHLQLALPYYNLRAWVLTGAVVLLTGLFAGSYPAFFLSSFNPVKVLKGSLNSRGKASVRPRQVLVVIQFAFAICLILSSMLIFKQVHYVKNRPLGYNNKGLIELLPEGNLVKDFEIFRREAIRSGAIVDGAISGGGINNSFGNTFGVVWPGQLAGEDKTMISQIATRYHFVSTMGLQLTVGRDFSEAYPADSSAVILNKAAVQMMRLKDPIGQKIKWQGRDREVVGVVKDFSINNPYDQSKPLIIGYMKDWIGNITLRLNPALPINESLSRLRLLQKQLNPGYPFDFKFTDAIFADKFQSEQKLGTLAMLFTVLSVIISCLGLFGLVAFSAEQRRKEIGIRKVLGASVGNVWLNLSKEFVLLVLISFVIGATVSAYMMKGWLLGYEYHTSVNAMVFLITLLLALAICLFTVSFQAIRAAVANPAVALRSE